MPILPRRLLSLVLLAVLVCGCSGKTGYQAARTDSAGKSAPQAWKPEPGTEAKITFYVKGMSDRLKLT